METIWFHNPATGLSWHVAVGSEAYLQLLAKPEYKQVSEPPKIEVEASLSGDTPRHEQPNRKSKVATR